ncbi:PAS domain-containing sensor histidine kinase [Microbacterium sp. NPDC096154]|uniref:sensor histidine kinase n=1 Tax=Microbacterium sp. NPDC096154 TaxID=3155549 RepID=UPI0033338C3F
MAPDVRSPRDPSRARTVILNQLLLTLIVLFASVLVVMSDGLRDLGAVIIGTSMVFLAGVFAVVARWDALPPSVSAAVPLVDIVAVGFFQYAHPTAGLALLWVFPVLWIALTFGEILTTVTALAVIAAYWILLVLTTTDFEVRGALFSLTVAALAMYGQLMSRRGAAQRQLLARQSLTLQGAFERARSQEALVSEVLQTVDFGVVRVDADGQVAVTNAAHARLHGDPDAPLFRADGVTPVPADERPLARARRGETFDGVELWHGGLGSGRRALHVTARRIRSDGESGVVLVSRDVTAEREALRARDDLVASVSHELRTPLTSIMGYLDLALDDHRLSDGTRRNLEVAERNAQRLLTLVTDILSSAADPAADLDARLRPASMDVGAVVHQAVEAALPRAVARQLTIDTEGVEATTAFADATRIRQVIDNLLSNAIKYSHHGGRVWIGCANEDGRAIVAVRDEGPGIAPAEQRRLFERFFRSDAVRRSSTHGSGLGLAIARDIVRAHGGEISVQSAVDAGATFVVTLPQHDPAAPDAAAAGGRGDAHPAGPGHPAAPRHPADPEHPAGPAADQTPFPEQSRVPAPSPDPEEGR